jgi:hypothetical protein
MRAKSFTVVGSAGGPTFSPVWVPDKYPSPANIGIGVVVSGAETIVDIQHTFADPWNQNLNIAPGVSAAWSNNATLVSATQASNPNGATDTNYAFYPNAIRMRVRALTSAGTGNRATVTFIQAGPES